MIEQITIKNRHGLPMHGAFECPCKTPSGLVIIQHGYTGMAGQPLLSLIAAAYHKAGWATLRLDATCSLNDAGGDVATWTATGHIEDLEDTLKWAASADIAPRLALAGHSMGGMAALSVAVQEPDRFHHVTASAPVVSGEQLLEAWTQSYPDDVKNWQETGQFTETSSLDPDRSGAVPWTIWDDWQRHDLLRQADKLTRPALILVGEQDELTTLADVKRLYEALPQSGKQFTAIPGGNHMYDGCEGQVFHTVYNWLSERAS